MGDLRNALWIARFGLAWMLIGEPTRGLRVAMS